MLAPMIQQFPVPLTKTVTKVVKEPTHIIQVRCPVGPDGYAPPCMPTAPTRLLRFQVMVPRGTSTSISGSVSIYDDGPPEDEGRFTLSLSVDREAIGLVHGYGFARGSRTEQVSFTGRRHLSPGIHTFVLSTRVWTEGELTARPVRLAIAPRT
jgi:hypothetical protein